MKILGGGGGVSQVFPPPRSTCNFHVCSAPPTHCTSPSHQVIEFRSPQELSKLVDLEVREEGVDTDTLLQLCRTALENSVHTGRVVLCVSATHPCSRSPKHGTCRLENDSVRVGG